MELLKRLIESLRGKKGTVRPAPSAEVQGVGAAISRRRDLPDLPARPTAEISRVLNDRSSCLHRQGEVSPTSSEEDRPGIRENSTVLAGYRWRRRWNDPRMCPEKKLGSRAKSFVDQRRNIAPQPPFFVWAHWTDMVNWRGCHPAPLPLPGGPDESKTFGVMTRHSRRQVKKKKKNFSQHRTDFCPQCRGNSNP